MSGKRYFWLKLYDDFFTSKRIKKLRSIAGGDTYTIIYLKMLLKALKTDGYLYFDGVMNNFAEELALDLDEKPEDVGVTIQFLSAVGLLECSEGGSEYILTFMENLIGSEDASAQRVRDYRERQKALHCNANVTECNADVTEVKRDGNAEIEKRREREEIEKEKEDSEEPILISGPHGPTIIEPPFIKLPLNDGTEYPVTFDEVDECKKLYPAVNVEQELRNMRGWCLSNPTKRKTKKGISKFIHTWLSKEQDRGGRPQQTTQAPRKQYQQMMTRDSDMSELEKRLIAN